MTVFKTENVEDLVMVMLFRRSPLDKSFPGVLCCGSVQTAGDLTAGMPLSPGMCWSLHAAYGSPLSPET